MRQTNLVQQQQQQLSTLELYPFAASPMPDELPSDFEAFVRWRDTGEDYHPQLGGIFYWVRRQQAWIEQQKQQIKLRVQSALMARVTMMEAVNATLSGVIEKQLGEIEEADTSEALGATMKALWVTLRNVRIAQDITQAAVPPPEAASVNVLQQNFEDRGTRQRPLTDRQVELQNRRQLRIADAEAARQV